MSWVRGYKPSRLSPNDPQPQDLSYESAPLPRDDAREPRTEQPQPTYQEPPTIADILV